MADLVETRRPGVLAPLGNVAHVDIPDVDVRIGELGEFHTIHFDFDGVRPVQGVHSEAGGYRAVVPHRFFHFLQRFHPESRPVFDRAAILVGTLVVIGGKKLEREIGMAAINVDDVETGVPGPFCRVDVETLNVVDVVLIHFVAVGQGLEF